MSRPDRRTYVASKRPVKSADRVVDLVHLLTKEPDGLTFEQLGQRLPVPRSSLHGLVVTLERRGWLTRARDGRRAHRYALPRELGEGVLAAARTALESS